MAEANPIAAGAAMGAMAEAAPRLLQMLQAQWSLQIQMLQV